MPKVSFRAVQASLEWKKFPQRIPDTAFFDVPNRIRTSIAKLINAQPNDIALTTGASSGMSGIAYGLTWKPGDEVITATGEFPLQYASWKPMEEREGIVLKVVKPRDRYLDADDIIAAITPRTRLVSLSLVRFDNGVLIDAARIGAACHAQGALFLVDASQACGAVPIDVQAMNIDFLVSAGYKFLLGPFGTGFCWGRPEIVAEHAPRPVLLDGRARHGARLLRDELRRSETRRRREALGRRRNRELFQSRRARREPRIRLASRPRNRARALPQSHRATFRAPAERSLHSREPARSRASRTVRMLSPRARPTKPSRSTTSSAKKMSSSACAKATSASRPISSTPSATSIASSR